MPVGQRLLQIAGDGGFHVAEEVIVRTADRRVVREPGAGHAHAARRGDQNDEQVGPGSHGGGSLKQADQDSKTAHGILTANPARQPPLQHPAVGPVLETGSRDESRRRCRV